MAAAPQQISSPVEETNGTWHVPSQQVVRDGRPCSTSRNEVGQFAGSPAGGTCLHEQISPSKQYAPRATAIRGVSPVRYLDVISSQIDPHDRSPRPQEQMPPRQLPAPSQQGVVASQLSPGKEQLPEHTPFAEIRACVLGTHRLRSDRPNAVLGQRSELCWQASPCPRQMRAAIWIAEMLMQAKPAQQGLASSQKKPAPMHWSISRPQWTVSSSDPRAVADAFEAAADRRSPVNGGISAGRPRGKRKSADTAHQPLVSITPEAHVQTPSRQVNPPQQASPGGATGSRLKALCANIRSGQCGGHGSANRGEDRATRCNTRQ